MSIDSWLSSLFGGTQSPSSLVGGNTWADLQNQAANYQYDPNNPGAWSDLQNKMAAYEGATSGVTGSGQAGGDALASALKNLSGSQQQQAQQQKPVQAVAPQGSAPLGHPMRTVDILQLINQLNQMKQAYMAPQAINPISATANTPQRGMGLLGV